MSDTLSLLVASGILALGGLGLFMMKNADEDEKDTTSEERIGIRWFLPEKEEDENETDIENVPENIDDYMYQYNEHDVHKPRRRGKTHSNRRVSGSSRRRY